MKGYRYENIKKILFAIMASAILISLAAISSLALTPPVIDTQTYKDYGVPCEQDIDYLRDLVNTQSALGSFNSLKPAMLYKGSSTNTMILLLVHADKSFSVSERDGNYVLTYDSDRVYRAVLTEDGFSFQTFASSFSIASNFTILYAEDEQSGLVKNAGFNYGAGLSNEFFDEAFWPWIHFYDAVNLYENKLDQQYNEGYDDGYSQGKTECESEHESIRSEGYNAGYVDGLTTGHNNGYLQGKTECESGHESIRNEGYEAGFEAGEDAGFDAGYDAGTSFGYSKGKYECELTHDALTQESYEKGRAFGYQEGEADCQATHESLMREQYEEGRAEGYTVGYSAGYDARGDNLKQELVEQYYKGKEAGFTEAVNTKESVIDYVDGLFSAPVNFLYTMLDVEIFGMNLFNVVMVFLSVVLVGVVLALVLKFRR